MYYSTSRSDGLSPRIVGLFKVNLTQQLNSVGTQIYSGTTWSLGWLSVSRDGAAIYSSQAYSDGSGTYPYGRFRFARLDLTEAPTPTVIAQGGTEHYYSGASDGTVASRLAYTEFGSSAPCYRLHVADWIGGIVQDTTLQPYARHPTLVNGKVLAEGYTSSKRSQCHDTGRIVEIDPNGGAVAELITGYNPDGR